MAKPPAKALSASKSPIQKPPGLRTDGSPASGQKELRDWVKRSAADIRARTLGQPISWQAI
jgi:hypothetical protein